jgi:uncharacterized hydrophobic protein (TIGR00271 family)
MPLLRITCPTGRTEQIVGLLMTSARAAEVAVIPSASQVSGGDVILADVPRRFVDDVIERLHDPTGLQGLHITVAAAEQLFPQVPEGDNDDEAVVWAQVIQDVHETGKLSVINVLLMVVAAMIAALGILQDQLLLIVGAMALSPDYFPVADACISIVRRDGARVVQALRTLAVSFGAGAVGALLLTEALAVLGFVDPATAVPSQQLTAFIAQPNFLSVVVAALAGVAGALAITLPDARGLVGVFVSITTIPAAANIGVASAAHDRQQLIGASVQLVMNVVMLLITGTITLEIRRYGFHRRQPEGGRHAWSRHPRGPQRHP